MSKRQRLSSVSNYKPTVISLDNREKVEGLWFPDGNLVLVTKTQVFRVYFGALAQQSAFFQSLLSDTKAVDVVCDLHDGAPVIYIFDHWNDLENFLMICFHGQYYHQQLTKESNHAFLVSLLRAATNFKAEGYRKEVWEKLASSYPVSPRSSSPMLTNVPPLTDLIWVIQSAQFIQGEILLPAALYFLSTYPLSTILATRNATPRLSRQHLNNCLKGREILIQKSQIVIWSYINYCTSNSAESHLGCIKVAASLASSNSKEGQKILISPINLIGRLVLELIGCSSCPVYLRKALDELRVQVWKELPGCFGQGSWERLREASSMHLQSVGPDSR